MFVRTFYDRLTGPFRQDRPSEKPETFTVPIGGPLPPPPDRSGLTFVGRGVTGEVTWELFDGPSSSPDRPDAIADWFSLAHAEGSGGGSQGLNAPLGPDDTVRVEWHRLGKGRRGYACLQARCSRSVDAAVVHYRNRSTVRLQPMTSSATQQRWIVCCFQGKHRARRIEFVDSAGTVLQSEDGSGPTG